jgi:hypothetical protein
MRAARAAGALHARVCFVSMLLFQIWAMRTSTAHAGFTRDFWSFT